MTNQNVIDMVAGATSDQVIIAAIRRMAGGAFEPRPLREVDRDPIGRERVDRQIGSYGARTRTRFKDVVDAMVEKLTAVIYQVTWVLPLAPGEC